MVDMVLTPTLTSLGGPPAPRGSDPESAAPRQPNAGRTGPAAPPADVLDIATSFQEVRLRDAAGLQSWRDSFPVGAAHADLFLDLHRSDPNAAHRLAQAVTAMPEAGS